MCPYGQTWDVPAGWTKHGPEVYLDFEQNHCLELVTGKMDRDPGFANVRQ